MLPLKKSNKSLSLHTSRSTWSSSFLSSHSSNLVSSSSGFQGLWYFPSDTGSGWMYPVEDTGPPHRARHSHVHSHSNLRLILNHNFYYNGGGNCSTHSSEKRHPTRNLVAIVLHLATSFSCFITLHIMKVFFPKRYICILLLFMGDATCLNPTFGFLFWKCAQMSLFYFVLFTLHGWNDSW